MNRSTALLTVLLAFAIFAIPTSAAPPEPYVMPVKVVNQDPVKVRDVSVEVCEKKIILRQKNQQLHSGINHIDLFKGREFVNKYLVIETASVIVDIPATSRVTLCALGTSLEDEGWELLFALPIIKLNYDNRPRQRCTFEGTRMVRVVVVFEPNDRRDINLKIELEDDETSYNEAEVEVCVSGYIVDSACPTP